jgi:hypothetical protein
LLYYDANATPAAKMADFSMKSFTYRRLLNTYQHATDKFVTTLSAKIPITYTGPEYLWILKPTQLNRGRGIHVIKDLD